MITDIQAKHIIENGKLYMPATSHYAHLYQTKVVVSCDYCSKSNLKICVGLDQFDLCMDCAQRIADVFYNENNRTYTESLGNIRPYPLSRMIQDSVTRQSPTTYMPTYMMQDSIVATTNMMQDSIVATTNMMQDSIVDTTNMMQDSVGDNIIYID